MMCRSFPQFAYRLMPAGIVLVGLLGSSASATTNTAEAATVVLLPLSNHTNDARVTDAFADPLREFVTGLSVNLITGDTVRDVFRERRIRAIGGIGQQGAAALREDFGADYVLTGSYDVFLEHPVSPEAGLSLRLIDLTDYRVVWARTTGATGKDYESLFGLGGVDQSDELAKRLVRETCKGLDKALATASSLPVTGEQIAIVPFDDILIDFPGGGVVTANVLTHLVARGFNTLEPGVVREFFITFQRFSRGGIDYEVLAALHDSLGVEWVVTGSVDGFYPASPELERSFPELSVNGRCIEADTHTIISAAVASGTGDHERVIGLGNTRAANDVARATTSDLLNDLGLKKGHWNGRH